MCCCFFTYFNTVKILYTLIKALTIINMKICLCRVRKLSDLIKNILICVPKMNKSVTGLEWNEGE